MNLCLTSCVAQSALCSLMQLPSKIDLPHIVCQAEQRVTSNTRCIQWDLELYLSMPDPICRSKWHQSSYFQNLGKKTKSIFPQIPNGSLKMRHLLASRKQKSLKQTNKKCPTQAFFPPQRPSQLYSPFTFLYFPPLQPRL